MLSGDLVASDMITRLEFAERRYRQLLPQPRVGPLSFLMRELLVWLKDAVCPVVDEYAKRPAFRAHATWPLRVLVPGASTAERGVVETVDKNLVLCARELVALARQKRVAKQLAARWPPRKRLTREEVDISGKRAQRIGSDRTLVDVLALETSQVQWISKRGWTDLVCPGDYFEPRGGWMSRAPGAAQAGDFLVAFNPELHPIGDFVTRCLVRRSDGFCETLTEFASKCGAAARAVGASAANGLERFQRAFLALRESREALTKTCLVGPEALIRDSCIVLTQTYAAFAATPDLGWLGLPCSEVQSGAATLRHRLTHEQNPEVSERIALALGDLRHLYAGGTPGQSQREEAIVTGALVIVGEARQVFWQGKAINANWGAYRVLWRLLERLARNARLQAPVGERDLYPESGALSKMATTLSRLRGVLPASLWKHIEPVRGKRAYRLHLPPNQVYLF
jgi:hypothetical protein